MRQLHNDSVGTKAVTECSATGRFRSRWEVYIKMDPTQLGIENHRWMEVAQAQVLWWHLVLAVY